jgi:hypothetical protein
MIEDPDTPSEVEDTEESTLDTEQEPDAVEYDEDGNPIEAEAEEDEEEIDLDDDLKLKVPKSAAEKLKELKEGALRQADYTRKTQELAEQRKSFETQRQAQQQMDAVETMARGDLANTNAQINQYEQFDWAAARANAQAIDSENFDRAQMDQLDAHWQNYQLLKSRQQKIGQLLAIKAQERQSREQQSRQQLDAAVAKLLDEGTPELKKAIPDWSRAKAATLTESMVKHYGIPRDEFDGIDDPKLYMVMADATAWREHQTKQKKAKTIEKQQEVVPAAKASAGKSAVAPGKLDDRLSPEEWVKRRNAQLSKG